MTRPAKPPPPAPPVKGGAVRISRNVSARGEEGIRSSLPVKGGRGEGSSLAPANKSLTKRGVLPYNKNLTNLARQNRKNPTLAERKIWNEVLRLRQFEAFKFLRQKPLGSYIVDFYCAELLLVIEIDGDSHAESIEYDAVRTAFLESMGLNVIRYTNVDVMQNIEGVFNDLTRRVLNKESIDDGKKE